MKYVMMFLFALTLTGCQVCAECAQRPEWVVDVHGESTCTGSLIAENEVLTARHCGRVNYIVLGDKHYPAKHILRANALDQVVYEIEPIDGAKVAEIGELSKSAPVALWGNCPISKSKMRIAAFGGNTESTKDAIPTYRFYANYVSCGGDSGGPLVQNGKLVGILNHIYDADGNHDNGIAGIILYGTRLYIMHDDTTCQDGPKPC